MKRKKCCFVLVLLAVAAKGSADAGAEAEADSKSEAEADAFRRVIIVPGGRYVTSASPVRPVHFEAPGRSPRVLSSVEPYTSSSSNALATHHVSTAAVAPAASYASPFTPSEGTPDDSATAAEERSDVKIHRTRIVYRPLPPKEVKAVEPHQHVHYAEKPPSPHYEVVVGAPSNHEVVPVYHEPTVDHGAYEAPQLVPYEPDLYSAPPGYKLVLDEPIHHHPPAKPAYLPVETAPAYEVVPVPSYHEEEHVPYGPPLPPPPPPPPHYPPPHHDKHKKHHDYGPPECAKDDKRYCLNDYQYPK